jgi:YVTN family beta-propeller protein
MNRLWGAVNAEALESRLLLSAVTRFGFGVSHFVEDPNTSLVYATETANNSVAVIDATTLNLVTEIPVGSQPRGIAISNNGSTVYVADSGANQIDAIDTATMAAGTPILLPAGQQPTAVEVGTNNRLWVQTGGGIEQIDATTGASTGPNLSSGSGQVGSSFLAETSPSARTRTRFITPRMGCRLPICTSST